MEACREGLGWGLLGLRGKVIKGNEDKAGLHVAGVLVSILNGAIE